MIPFTVFTWATLKTFHLKLDYSHDDYDSWNNGRSIKNLVTWRQTNNLCIPTGTNLPPTVKYCTCGLGVGVERVEQLWMSLPGSLRGWNGPVAAWIDGTSPPPAAAGASQRCLTPGWRSHASRPGPGPDERIPRVLVQSLRRQMGQTDV